MKQNFNCNWNIEKNNWLKENRDICFEEVIVALDENRLVKIKKHPNKEQYPNQFIMFLFINDHIYLVPYVYEDDNTIFLKTMYPSSKATKKYLKTSKV